METSQDKGDKNDLRS